MRLRWKRQKKETGLAAVCAPPRGYEYHDGERLYAMVSPLMNIRRRSVVGWYWVAGWDGRDLGVPHKNTCGTPCETPEDAKAQAVEYVTHHLANATNQRLVR